MSLVLCHEKRSGGSFSFVFVAPPSASGGRVASLSRAKALPYDCHKIRYITCVTPLLDKSAAFC